MSVWSGRERLSGRLSAALIVLSAGCRKSAPPEPPASTTVDPRPSPTMAETAAATASAAPRAIVPFALPPPPPAWGAKAATRPRSTYFTEWVAECQHPEAIGGFTNEKDDWTIVAYRCREPMTPYNGPDPWLSDGSFFLWGVRDDVAIEVIGHLRRGPRPYQLRRYVEEALAKLGPPPARRPMSAEERASVEQTLAKVERVLKAAVKCDETKSDEVLGALRALEEGALPKGMLDVVKGQAMVCLSCYGTPSGKGPRCGYALEVLGDLAEASKRW